MDSKRPMDDEAQAVRAQNDRQAFAVLYDRYFTSIYNYIRLRCGNPQTADDLTAMAFERALRHIAAYRPRKASFKTWLFTIARNALNDHLRTQRRHPQLPLDAMDQGRLNSPNPEQRLIQREMRDELLSAMQYLEVRERDLLALKYAAGLTNRQIASMSGLSESNVGVILFRALRRLRSHLKDASIAYRENEYE